MDDSTDYLLSDPEAERDLVGAVIYDEKAFDLAELKSEDFFIHRFRWIWQACEAIRSQDDAIDVVSLRKQLEKAGHWPEVTNGEPLTQYYTATFLHVKTDSRKVRDMAERRRIVADLTAQVKRTLDLNIPLPPPPEQFKTHWTQSELAATEFPEPGGIIPGLIPIGLTLLCGRPKRGKSWLMLQAGCSLAMGGQFLGRDLHEGKVLYYALEDRPQRLKDRTEKLGIPGKTRIEYELTVPALYLGGLARVEKAAREGGYKMIVIDTIWRAMPGKDYLKDGAAFDDIFSRLQQVAQQNQVAIVAILHTRKKTSGFDPDPVDDVLGSTSLTASADCILALYTEEGKKGATLMGRGRDLDDIDESLQFDPQTCTWQSLGTSGEVKVSDEENEILLALRDLGKEKVSSIAREIHKDRSNTSRRCNSLWVQGKLRKEEIEGVTYFYLPTYKTQDTYIKHDTQATQPTQGTQPTQPTQTTQVTQAV